jgi:hypothetical protein
VTLPWEQRDGRPGTANLLVISRPEAQDKAKRAVDTLFERLDEVADDPLCGPDVAREAP